MGNLEPGMIVVAVAMLFFYLRLVQLRGRRKREAREADLALMRKKGKGNKQGTDLVTPQQKPLYIIRSWFMVAGGALLMLAGLALRQSLSWLPASLLPFQQFWWAVATLGVIVFIFSFK